MAHVKEEEISAYIDRQLDADEKLSVETHLRGCENCRAVLEGINEINHLFREAERVAPSAFLWNRIEAGLINREQARGLGWRAAVMAGLRNYSRSLGVAAAALAICLAAGLTIMHKNARQAAEQAALEVIDQTRKSLAAQDPEAYNPFSSGSLDLDANPFKNFRLSGGTAPAN